MVEMASKVRIKGANSKQRMRTEHDWNKHLDIQKELTDCKPTSVNCCVSFDKSPSPTALKVQSSIAHVRDYLLQQEEMRQRMTQTDTEAGAGYNEQIGLRETAEESKQARLKLLRESTNRQRQLNYKQYRQITTSRLNADEM